MTLRESSSHLAPACVRVAGPIPASGESVLTPGALAFVAALERAFRDRRRELLERRRATRARLDAGLRLDFPAETRAIRAGDWKVAPPPPDLVDRRVEITGPTDRKMVVNALNSGANVFMADFEDATAPTFANLVEGQANLRDAVRRRIDFTHPETGRRYALLDRTATLVVRPRGWHLDEAHVRVDGAPISGALFDFGLYLFHNAAAAIAAGTGPYFYLPKLESRHEARLWNDVFVLAQDLLGLPHGTIRATVLIETLPAAFEMDEILYELRDHSTGLNCGRWDYLFSFLKVHRNDPRAILPDRARVGMDRRFLASYARLLIQTCHRRGAHAMGGMAAQIPIKDDPARNQVALEKVRADKRREAEAGHDGTWVAHPGLVALAREEFDRVLQGRPNQLDVLRAQDEIRAADLLEIPHGAVTEAGLRTNLEVGVRYLAAWLSGNGCVPIHHLMEDAATAEISRTQVWHWRRHGARLADGRAVDAALVRATLARELERIAAEIGPAAFEAGRYALAGSILERLCTDDELEDFLTLAAYPHIATEEP